MLERERFRTCEVTGLQVYLPSERLITVNAVTAVVFLALGGVLALLIALTRWQAVHLLPPDLYYQFVTAHGINMLVFWIVFFEVAGLYFGGSVLLNARLAATPVAWLSYAVMLGGAVLTNVMVFTGQGTVMFTAYPPMKAHPFFYLGLILFAVGALAAVILFLVNVVLARAEGRVKGSVPLVTFALIAAAVIATFTLVSGAMALVPMLFWSLGLTETVDPAVYRLLFWGFGHGAQQVNLAAMVGVWYALASLTVGARPLNEGLCRTAFILYVLFINLGSMHHLLVDPGLGTASRIFNTSYAMYLAVLASMIHAFSIPSAVEVAQRERGYRRGLFQWLVDAPWREPGFAALAVSFVIFGFLAGTSGVIMGTMQINMIAHNTLIVPGHFHATVVAGTTVAFMGLAYYLVPLITRKQLVGRGWARVQPYLYGFGLLLLIGGLMLAGQQGVPRRHWDINLTDAAVSLPVYQTAGVDLATALIGIGAIVAVAGGAIFVLVMLATLFFGQFSARPDIRFAPAYAPMAGGAPETPHAGGKVEAPGTLVLVFIFLAWFVALYFLGWVNLSGAWPVR